MQIANDMYSSTENLPTDAKEEHDDVMDGRADNIVCISSHPVVVEFCEDLIVSQNWLY